MVISLHCSPGVKYISQNITFFFFIWTDILKPRIFLTGSIAYKTDYDIWVCVCVSFRCFIFLDIAILLKYWFVSWFSIMLYCILLAVFYCCFSHFWPFFSLKIALYTFIWLQSFSISFNAIIITFISPCFHLHILLQQSRALKYRLVRVVSMAAHFLLNIHWLPIRSSSTSQNTEKFFVCCSFVFHTQYIMCYILVAASVNSLILSSEITLALSYDLMHCLKLATWSDNVTN